MTKEEAEIEYQKAKNWLHIKGYAKSNIEEITSILAAYIIENKALHLPDVGRTLVCELCNGKIDREDKFTEEKHCENCGWF